MAVFAGDAWKRAVPRPPPLRKAVCVGHILLHERLHDGRYNVLLQGVCRARIVRELSPDELDGKLYRAAEWSLWGLSHPIPRPSAARDSGSVKCSLRHR